MMSNRKWIRTTLSQNARDKLNGLIDTVNGYITKGFSDATEPPQTVYDDLRGAVDNLKSYAGQVLVATPSPTDTWSPRIRLRGRSGKRIC